MTKTKKPAIVEAAQAHNMLNAALGYANLGISVIPCHGKTPAVIQAGPVNELFPWHRYQHVRPTAQQIVNWHQRGWLQNVGVICGAVSRNLVVIDLDGLDAVEAFEARFTWSKATYAVASGSGKGKHIYFQVSALPSTTRVVGSKYGNIELRSNGTYVVTPPSIHPNSKQPYIVDRAFPVMRVDNLHGVQKWIKELMAEKHGGSLPPPTPPQPVPNASRWALSALARECDGVRTAPVSGRNIMLNRAAFKLGQLVGGHLLTREDVESSLVSAAAALSADDGEAATWRTIQSGIEAGIKNPRQIRK